MRYDRIHYIALYLFTKPLKMTHFQSKPMIKATLKWYQSKPHIFRSEVIGFIHIFDCDIEVQTDLCNEIIDYSGCGFKKAQQLIQQIK